MKYLYIIILAMTLFACEEEKVMFHKSNSDKPENVTNVNITPTNGGAIITYDLPSDESLLYVKAVYFNNKKELADSKASLFMDSLFINGLKDTTEQKVSISTITRDNVESDIQEFTFKPLISPVDLVVKSIKTLPDFGGVNIECKNFTKDNLSIITMFKDTNNIYVEKDAYYTSLDSINFSVRGFEDNPTDFKILVRDRYDNYSDPYEVNLTPLYEQELNRSLWRQLTLPNEAYLGEWGGSFSKMTDFNTTSEGNYGHTDGEAKGMYFSWDLGVKAKVSRFVLWQRYNWEYRHHNPRKFELWGSNNPSDDGSFTGWTKIRSCESKKPSEQPIGQNTDEDLEYARRGEEFTFPLDSEPYRYLRFVLQESWAGGSDFMLGEMTAYGQIINNDE